MTMKLDNQKETWKAEVSSAIWGMVEKNRIAQTESVEDDENDIWKKIERIRGKLESGEALSQSDLRYLKKYAPQLYALAMRVQMKRESVEEQCKHAKSKAEIHDIHFTNISMVSKEDPAKEYIIAAVNKVIKDFKETKQYKRLPDNAKEDNKKKMFLGCDLKQETEFKAEAISDEDGQEVSLQYDLPVGNYQETYLAQNVLSFNKLM